MPVFLLELARTPSLSPRFARILAAFLGFAITACAYSNALDGAFLWDDFSIVPALARHDSPSLLNEAVRALRMPFWSQVSSYYRPVTVLSYLSDEALYGTTAAGYHLTNVVLHCLNTTLLIALLLRRKLSPSLALACGLFFGLMPRLTEAVTWVSGRTDVLALFFALGALHAAAFSKRSARFITGVLFLFALLSKEVAVVFLLVPFLTEEFRTGAASRSQRWKLLAPWGLSFALYLTLRFASLGFTRVEYATLGAGHRLQLALESCARYAFALVNPWTPSTLQGHWLAPQPNLALVGGILVVGSLGLLWLLVRRGGELTRLGCLAFVLPLGLVLNLIPITVVAVASDRFLYVPAFGLALLAGDFLSRAKHPIRWTAALLTLSATFSIATWLRNTDYADEAVFWLKARDDSIPTDATATNELSLLYAKAGLYREAIQLGTSRTDLDPIRAAEVELNVARAEIDFGALENARSRTERGCLRGSESLCRGLALVRLSEGDVRAARQILLRLRKSPQVESLLDSLHALEAMPRQNLPERFYYLAATDTRGEALELAARLFEDPASSSELRRDAFEYQLRFLDPRQLPALAKKAREELEMPAYRAVFEERQNRAAHLMELYRSR